MHALALLAALTLGQFGPPAWGTPGAGSSPVCNPPAASQFSSLANEQAARAFYDSINGPTLARSVVRVSIKDRDGSGSLGSGTLVEAFEGGTGLVVTNNHVVKDAASATAGSITYRSGEQSRLTILDRDTVWDLAILDVHVPADVSPISLADAPPQTREIFAIAGYGSDSRLAFQVGAFSQRLAPARGYPFEQFELRPCQARQGDSGGPVFDRTGKLAGTLWGSDRGQTGGATTATPCTRIRALLDSIRQRLGRRPRGQQQQPPQFAGPLVPVNPPAQPSQPIASSPPPASPAQPPRESAPPQNPNGSGPSTGGELAGLQGRLQKLEHDMAERLRNDAAAAKPAIVDGAKQLAEDAIAAAAPSIMEKLLPYALTALGGLTGFGLPVGGVAAGSWIASKVVRIFLKRSAARIAAKHGSDSAGTMSTGGTDAPAFSPRAVAPLPVAQPVNPYQPPMVQARPPVPDLPPVFVPTQIDDPHFLALKEALKALGSEGPQNSHFVRRVYDFQRQLLARAS